MIIGWGTIITTFAAWAINKAAPAVWHHHVDAKQAQIEEAKDLCEKHGDCEAQKIQALQGMKPVVRLKDGQ